MSRWTKLFEQTVEPDDCNFKFWSGIMVWIERPHLVNRKLLATEMIDAMTVSCTRDESQNIILKKTIFQFLKDNLFESTGFEEYCRAEIMVQNFDQSADESSETLTLKLRKLIPRSLAKFSDVLEVVLLEDKKKCVTFWPKESDVQGSPITPCFPYRIKYYDQRFIVETFQRSEITSTELASEEWLKSTVSPKLFKWCCNSPTSKVLPSLRLAPIKNYSENYHNLKEKYGKKYVEMWPECSDPLKYVYEDIAIAAYLMTIWEKERTDLNLSSKQSFVDLGCGNGLLVDILASEGHVGIGIDIRKRKIWDLYDSHTNLIEKVVEPSSYHLFPDYDWIIGNHSDELTPWIPVIAARSCYKMRVFLLPCCSFTFNGKYERNDSEKTQYQSYLSFVHSLCESMGFYVQEDKLRIPSTKRICFLCTSRTYKEEDEESMDIKRQEFIVAHSIKNEHTSSFKSIDKMSPHEKCWISDFKPRDRVEIVQNCSKLDRGFLDETVKCVANILLKHDNYIYLQKGSQLLHWNSGGKVKLGDLIKLVDQETLRCMKNQYGGFQTFLRNHKNVFQINNGIVHLSVPSKDAHLNFKSTGKRKNRKKKVYSFQEKPCYFFLHHPQGCPLESVDCSFSHKTIDK